MFESENLNDPAGGGRVPTVGTHHHLVPRVGWVIYGISVGTVGNKCKYFYSKNDFLRMKNGLLR